MKKKLFHSAQTFSYPDVKRYETQKHLHVITAHPRKLKYQNLLKMPAGFPNSKLWKFYGPRLELALFGNGASHLTHFPGHIVPGMGEGRRRKIGSLSFEKFLHVLDLHGGFPHPPHEHNFFYSTEEINQPVWLWEKVPKPYLQIIHPVKVEEKATPTRKHELVVRLDHELDLMLKQWRIPTKKILNFVRRNWSPDTKVRWTESSLSIAQDLFLQAKSIAQDIDWLSFVFEVENCVSRIQYSQKLNLHSWGQFNGCWIEVGSLILSEIHSTELCVTERLLAELISVRTRGFAPIVVNEFGSDTDGTHRLTASWMWNLLQTLKGLEFSFENKKFQNAVYRFIRIYKKEMGPVITHEILRVLQEIISDNGMFNILCVQILPGIDNYKPITRLPVLFLPEYSAGTVLKSLYDDGIGAYRVNPVIYEVLSKNRHLVLPPRGPYHLTDRSILPWFQILEPI